MTRTTTLATLLAAALGLSACMSNTAGTTTDAGVTSETGIANDVYDADEGETMGDAVSSPTDGIEDGPDL